MLEDRPAEWTRGPHRVTTDRGEVLPALDDALALLHDTHWGAGMRRDVLERAARNCVCFLLTTDGRVEGFARATSDLATYAYLSDVVIAPAARGRGLGRFLVECVLSHPDLQGLRRIALLTRDAAGLYERLGFTHGPGNRSYMERLG
jgi:ribosomal protein S18 acetylase RimI-like enzyme